jgi:phosphate starvation-inducible PhoH-like protein
VPKKQKQEYDKFVAARPKSNNQREYLRAIDENIIVICRGHAGCGKTMLSLSAALKLFYDKTTPYDQIIVVRPYIKSNLGEDLGALPGKIDEKVGPFAESIMDNLRQLCSREESVRLIRSKNIDFTVLSMCRGRSFNNCVVIVEEAQNIPIRGDGMKMLLTRVGNNCKMIICGDVDQIDLIGGRDASALCNSVDFLKGIDNLSFVDMYELADIQRSKIVKDILERFNNGEQNGSNVRSIQNGIRSGSNGHNRF